MPVTVVTAAALTTCRHPNGNSRTSDSDAVTGKGYRAVTGDAIGNRTVTAADSHNRLPDNANFENGYRVTAVTAVERGPIFSVTSSRETTDDPSDPGPIPECLRRH